MTATALATPALAAPAPDHLTDWVDPGHVAPLLAHVAERVPGGRHLGPHLFEGPYWLVSLDGDPSLEHRRNMQLLRAAFPPVQVGYYAHPDRMLDERVDLFVLPQLALELVAEWNSSAPQPSQVGVRQLAHWPGLSPADCTAILGLMLGRAVTVLDAGVRHGFDLAVTEHGLHRVLRTMGSLAPPVYDYDGPEPPALPDLVAITSALLSDPAAPTT